MKTKEELIEDLARYSHCQLAGLISIVLEVAVQTHPEEIRKSLGLVFDLSGVESTTQGIMSLVQESHQKAIACRAQLRSLERDIDKARKRLESLEQRLEGK